MNEDMDDYYIFFLWCLDMDMHEGSQVLKTIHTKS